MKSISFLHFSDTHLGIGLKPKSRKIYINHRSNDFKKNFQFVIKRAYQNDIDFVIHTGDVFDRSRPHEPTKTWAINEFYKLSKLKPVLIIPGNHDKSLIDIKLFSTFSNFKVFNRPETISISINDFEINVSGIPFFRKAQDKFLGYLKKSKFKQAEYSILMLHQLIENSQHGIHNFTFTRRNNEVILNEDLPNCDYIALGHVHRFQNLPKNVYYAGSTERTAFLEREEIKGFIIGKILKQGAFYYTEILFNPLETRPMIQVEVDYTEKIDLREKIINKIKNHSSEVLINCQINYEEVNPQNDLYVIQNQIKKENNINNVRLLAKKIK